MKIKNGFTLIENNKEIKTYLDKEVVSRKITKIQVHHMAAPDYNTWKNTDLKKWTEPHFGRTESLDSYGETKWGSKDSKGKYIAQHFNVFPDGKITTGRSLNNTPIGISGWNTNAICIETYGNFDKGKDVMNEVQKQAVIALVAELCVRFKITPSFDTIRYHSWFTSKGVFLGGYVPGKSTKTCPGTNFFGGNTRDAFEENFLPLVKKYINGDKPKVEISKDTFLITVTANVLNIRTGPGTKYTIKGTLKKGPTKYTIVETQGKWGRLKSGAGWIHLGYTETVK